MKRSVIQLLLLGIGLAFLPSAGAEDVKKTERVLLPVFADADAIQSACQTGLSKAQEMIGAFANQALTPEEDSQTLTRWNALDMAIDDVIGPIGLMAAVMPDKAAREASEACDLQFSNLKTALHQNIAVYERLQRATAATPVERQVKSVLLEEFADAGAALAPDRRAEVKTILDQLDSLGIEFSRNTRENLAPVQFVATELAGMPEDYLASHQPNEAGIITLALNYPDFMPFMDNAVNVEARQRYYTAFNRIGGDRNLAILNQAAALRKQLATIFGNTSYAEYVIARRMAGTPAKVLAFLDSVKDKIREVEKRDLEILRQAKAEFLQKPLAEVKLDRWDLPFYTERVRRSKFAVDQNALRKYFPTEASLNWLFDLAKRLYGVNFVAASVPVWHKDVRYYDILDADGKRIAGAYFDLFPRDGKYNHAAVWPVRGASTRADRQPISAMVANLNRQGLDHQELETLLHEFGHMLHGTLSRTEFNALAGTNVRRDFVEAPSQMLEEWARNSETLALIRNHCRDCPAVDGDLLKRINRARQFAAGILYGRQHLLASYDMAMAGPEPGDSLATYQKLEAATPLGVTPGTTFPSHFDHLLGGYAAGYYGYMWSEVLAQDMASQWHGKLLDATVSRRYLDSVLSRGGEVPPDQMVRNFLGREPSPEPFFAEITGSRHD